MFDSQQTIAFFGATGGSACTLLARALQSGHHCTALARTPSKLSHLLATEHGISSETMNRRLKIHQGDAKSPVDVSKALVSPTNNKVLVDIIHTSIGAYPRFQFSIFQPFPLTDPTICESGMAALFSAIDQLSTEGTTGNRVGQKPLLITISATASRNLWHSLPLPLFTAPLYAWLLSSPQTDKLKMEELLCADGGAHLRSFVIIRPAILTDGVERGIESVRVGWEWGVDDVGRDNMGPGPAKGWTIGRRDLGAWVFKKVLVEGGWEGKCVSLCY